MDIPASGNTGASATLGIPHDVLVKQKQGQAILIWAIGASVLLLSRVFLPAYQLSGRFCIYGWEWILCAPKEHRLVWKKPMNVSEKGMRRGHFSNHHQLSIDIQPDIHRFVRLMARCTVDYH